MAADRLADLSELAGLGEAASVLITPLVDAGILHKLQVNLGHETAKVMLLH